jgi:hypothetical protein
MELTLCNKCAGVYYCDKTKKIRRADYEQMVKTECDICRTRKGFDFKITDRKVAAYG